MNLHALKNRLSMILMASGCLFLGGCIFPKPEFLASQKRGVELKPQDKQISSFRLKGSPLNGQVQQKIREALKSTRIANIDSQALWAISNCQCVRNVTSKVLKNYATYPGALPQLLVPQIRQEIAEDSKLKALLQLENKLPTIGALLQNMFASDAKIAQSIRDGIDQKLDDALVDGTELKKNLDYRFDFFAHVKNRNDLQKLQPGQHIQRQVSFDHSASLWALIWGIPAMWNGESPIANKDHGLQLLHSMRSLAEWQYIMGLEVDSTSGRPHGGLTFDPSGALGNLAAFDPRTLPDDVYRVFGGEYQVSYSSAGAIDLALSGFEQWRRLPNPVNLNEQSRLAVAAALAFKRMRPENRQYVKKLFGSAEVAIFPEESAQLPLIFLSGYGGLLANHFVDPKTRQIFETSKGASERQSASLLSLARMARATNMWNQETKSVGGGNFDPAIRQRLIEGSQELLDASQLAIQAILANHISTEALNSPESGLALVMDLNSQQIPSLEVSAEVLSTLVELERKIDGSPLLKRRILELFHWFAAVYLSELNNQPMTIQGVLWTHSLFDQMLQDKDYESQISWISKAQATFSQLVSEWGGANW
jgi:hypothetical protein